MLSNWSVRVSRPWVLMVSWNCWACRSRRRADAAERRLDVLALDRRHDVGRREIEGREPVGVEPQPERIVEGAEQARLADAAHARQRVDDIDRRVVVQVQRIVGLLRRVERDDLQQCRGFLADDEALALHFDRQERRGELRPVLHVHRVDVGIGAERERHGEGVAAVGGAGRLVVERIVDAGDLLLDGLGDGRLDHLGIGAGIEGRHRDLRRDDLGKLRDRDLEDRQQAGQGDDDRDDEGEPRPIDEDARYHGGRPSRRPAAAGPSPARPGPAAPSGCRRRSPCRLRGRRR